MLLYDRRRQLYVYGRRKKRRSPEEYMASFLKNLVSESMSDRVDSMDDENLLALKKKLDRKIGKRRRK